MAKSKAQVNFLEPIFVDCFAGGGGWSTGAEMALSRPIDIAVNHDPDAVLMHKTNHPHTRHYCEDIYDVVPKEAVAGRNVAWVHFSPDCKHHSKAAGRKPKEKKIRGLAWVVLRWAAEVRPNIISLENVEEFLTWGPLRKGRPIKSKAGITFNQWKKQLEALGYDVEHRILVASDYGTPTSRKRLFVIARCDGQPIVWPEITHGNPKSDDVKSGKLLPWRTAAEIIDWSLPVPSIFASKTEIMELHGINSKRPLADNTLRRVIRGVDKFVIKAKEPYIVSYKENEDISAPSVVVVNHSGDFRGQEAEKPLQTITGKHGYGVSNPVLKPYVPANNTNAGGSSLEAPIATTTTGGLQMFTTPVLTALGQTGGASDRCRSIDAPVHTTVVKAESCMIAPTLMQYHTEQSEKVITNPIFTIDAANRHGLVGACLTKYYGGNVHGQSIQEPQHTITTKDRSGLVTAEMVEFFGDDNEKLTIPYMSKYFSGGYTGVGVDIEAPVPTITAVDHNAVVATHIVKMKGDNLGQSADEPIQTVTASGLHFGAVTTTIIQASPEMELYNWSKVRELLNQYCDYKLKDDEILLIAIKGIWYYIADIGLRMLSPCELFAANGFPADYVIDKDYNGNEYGKTKQVARCGNAVPPPFATALVRANAPEYCGGSIETMSELNDIIAV